MMTQLKHGSTNLGKPAPEQEPSECRKFGDSSAGASGCSWGTKEGLLGIILDIKRKPAIRPGKPAGVVSSVGQSREDEPEACRIGLTGLGSQVS